MQARLEVTFDGCSECLLNEKCEKKNLLKPKRENLLAGPQEEKRFSRTLSGDEDFLEIESHRATCLPLIQGRKYEA